MGLNGRIEVKFKNDQKSNYVENTQPMYSISQLLHLKCKMIQSYFNGSAMFEWRCQ
jgi:hypothetical protein